MEKICIICSKVFVLKKKQPVITKCCSVDCINKNRKNIKSRHAKIYGKIYKRRIRITGSEVYKKHLEYNKKYLTKYNKLESTRLKKYNKNDPIQKAKEIKRVNIWRSKKVKIDKLFKLKLTLRNQIYRILDGEKKQKYNIKTFDLLGCTPKYLKEYLEKKFKPGMNWDNYGNLGWHIDHIKPLSLAKDEEDVIKGKFFHYSNLQPLWADENIKKSNKYDEKI